MEKEDSNFTCTAVDEEKEIVLIAGGKLGPFKDWVTETLKNNPKQDIRLFFGANSKTDLNGSKQLYDLSDLTDNFQMVTALNSPNPEWEGEAGLITDVVRDQVNPKKVNKCFLYGTRVMIDETKQALNNMGIPGEKIHHKSFTRDY
ncbi:hypothetical protein KGY79_05080 [Candidatus Bipolaricaulota bacterium]|nr:hypothetical protein [Candidatus Bipolaricaulota bacterium]